MKESNDIERLRKVKKEMGYTLAELGKKMALPPISKTPASKDTRVRVELLEKTIASASPKAIHSMKPSE